MGKIEITVIRYNELPGKVCLTEDGWGKLLVELAKGNSVTFNDNKAPQSKAEASEQQATTKQIEE